CQKYINAPLTF
nr:immunoglobulin light chain junction region [Macaca mulatta]MOW10420.1 immunoglobulin light chain junction region [Macaca mulatta]MOW12275.1 immunoglobulin light chain junction region [Macaca mulatta]MOW12288.1 immunoglobulin light chain junction region [Macaca mulatta]MOW12305.1 immunoglobulin light chain junction region [Macaca mulatta]